MSDSSADSEGWNWGGWSQTIPGTDMKFSIFLPGVLQDAEYRALQTCTLPDPPDIHHKRRLINVMADRGFNPLLLSPVDVYHCACLLFECAIQGLGFEGYALLARVHSFIFALQRLYPSNPYHSFRHAVDVLQSVYLFFSPEVLPPVYLLLVEPLQRPARARLPPEHPFASLQPLEVLGMLFAAVGHDVGHPGVTAVFLENVCAPLTVVAPLSPLESLHYKLLSQLLKTHGLNLVLENSSTEELMRVSILATDMRFHQTHMERFGNAFSQKAAFVGPIPKTLVCQALLKAADICNPARPFQTGAAWSSLVIDEWSMQARLEDALGIHRTQKVAPPIGSSAYELEQAKGQLGFMDACTIPLFEVVRQLLPGPKISSFISSCYTNRATWVHRAAIYASHIPASATGVETPPDSPQPM